jgi:predicted nucleotidyltransferase component of viral defense system
VDLERVNRIKRQIIIALFSDDELMELLVLKGGNAIDLIHGAAMRSSIDLDFSLEGDFSTQNNEELRQRFARLLNTALGQDGYCAFDVAFAPRPPIRSGDLYPFWGGYRLEFKVIARETYDALAPDDRRLRVTAETVSPGRGKKFRVEFSRHEYCKPKQECELDGYTIYVYTPEMIVCEKLRAICQQMSEYRSSVDSIAQSARARDFFDIFTLIQHYAIDLAAQDNLKLVTAMFEAKRVPISLLGDMGRQRAFHAEAYPSLRETVKPGVRLRGFDYYFDFVLSEVEKLKSLWVE